MKITFEEDRIRLQAETTKESQAIISIHDLVFFGKCDEEIANDHGSNRRGLNYCCVPLPMSPEASVAACVASSGRN